MIQYIVSFTCIDNIFSTFRCSAARSKLRQRLAFEGQKVKLDMLEAQKANICREISTLNKIVMEMEKNGPLRNSRSLPLDQTDGRNQNPRIPQMPCDGRLQTCQSLP